MQSNVSATDGVPVIMTELRELTFGEKLVGASFNPSKDPRVDEVKQHFACVADLLHKHMVEKSNATNFDSMFVGMAYGDIKRACMAAVALLTNQH